MKVPLSKAERKALGVVGRLRPYCETVQIAGSIRRQRPEPKDIEIVCTPAYDESGLWGHEPRSKVPRGVSMLLRHDPHGELVKDGDSFKQLILREPPAMVLDLFIVNPRWFGYQFAIRTGPATFSQRLVTNRSRGGLLHDAAWCQDGKVWVRRDSELCPADAEPGQTFGVEYPTPSERDFFQLIEGGWVDPEKRV